MGDVDVSLPELVETPDDEDDDDRRIDVHWNEIEDEFQAHRDECSQLERQLQPRPVRPATVQPHRACGRCCCERDPARNYRFRGSVRRMVHFINVSPRQKALILDRYVALVEQYSGVKRRYTRAYHCTRFFTTLFGIITPGLVSIQPFFGSEATTNPMYWSVFTTSLAAALLNGYISLFKIDKKFASSTRAYLNLESEGWQYFSLVGKYAKINPVTGARPSHANRFNLFMDSVERIRKGEAKVNYTNTSGGPSASGNIRSEPDLRAGGVQARRSASKTSH